MKQNHQKHWPCVNKGQEVPVEAKDNIKTKNEPVLKHSRYYALQQQTIIAWLKCTKTDKTILTATDRLQTANAL